MAVKEPWRVALSYLREAAGEDLFHHLQPTGFLEQYGERKINDILTLSGKREFSPLSSGAGRLFDAVSSLLGICSRNTFEGEASIALESLVTEGVDDAYPVDIHAEDRVSIDFSHAVLAIISDMKRGIERGIIAARFHNTVVAAVMRVVVKLSMIHNIKKTALCGGVFQNAYLSDKIRIGLEEEGLQVYEHAMVPCNDAGISLGQAYIARERIKAGT
jgi:hydrogenase maturation protein HypF